MSLKKILIKRRRWAIGLIVLAAASAVFGRYLVDRIPEAALYLALTALIYLVVGIVDWHQADTILESMSKTKTNKKEEKDKR